MLHEMLTVAQQRVAGLGLDNVSFREECAEAIPADDESCEVLLALLSLM